jgi:hypothetical protein
LIYCFLRVKTTHIRMCPLPCLNSLNTATRVVIVFLLACVSALPCWNYVQFFFRYLLKEEHQNVIHTMLQVFLLLKCTLNDSQ